MRNLEKYIIYACLGASMAATSWAAENDKPACYHLAIVGDREAQFQLAECYRNGNEMVQDWELAYQWYKKSAEQDYTPAMHALAVCLIYGYGAEKNPQESIKILTICAERGYMKSIHAIINVYMFGCEGIEKNLDVAKKWAKIGAEQGDVACMSTYGVLLLVPAYGTCQTEEGKMWLQKAAQAGDAVAQYELGAMYYLGNYGENKDYVAAKYWLSLASEQNHAIATFVLGLIYYKGLGVEQNMEKFVQLCLKSAQLGYGSAQICVALMYARGEGLPEVPEHAIYWAKKAVDQGEPGADRIYQTLLQYYYFDNDAIIPVPIQDIDFNSLLRKESLTQ